MTGGSLSSNLLTATKDLADGRFATHSLSTLRPTSQARMVGLTEGDRPEPNLAGVETGKYHLAGFEVPGERLLGDDRVAAYARQWLG